MSTLKIRTAAVGLALLVAPALLVACGSDDPEPTNSDQVTTTTSPDAMEEDKDAMTEDKDAMTEDKDAMTEDKDAMTEDKDAMEEEDEG